MKRKRGKNTARDTTIVLQQPKWEQLKEFPKNVFVPSEKCANRPSDKVDSLRSKQDIHIMGEDCPKPLKRFKEIELPDGVKNVLQANNFNKPTPIQSQGIPVAASGRDMVGIAKTGSGKTLAFILPALLHIKYQPKNWAVGKPHAIVLSPTRELAQQTAHVARMFGDPIGIKTICVYGGEPPARHARAMQQLVHLLISTPGRLLDLIAGTAADVKNCTYLVLDEADIMFDMGFESQIRDILGQVRPDRQLLMFSATWPAKIQKLADDFLINHIDVNVGCLDLATNHSITQVVDVCNENSKFKKLVTFLEENMHDDGEAKLLVFVETKARTDHLYDELRKKGWLEVKVMHGDVSQVDRNKTIRKFKSGKCKILIATNVASRGLDVTDVKFVINFDFPDTLEEYVHRIGRTGRWGNTGRAVTYFTVRDRDHARGLITLLKEAGQEVPNELVSIRDSCPPPETQNRKFPKKTKYFGTDE